MRLTQVSALSFDLDDTLWPFGPSVVRAEGELRTWLIAHAPGTERVLPTQQALSDLREEYERLCPDLAGDFRAMRIGSIRLALERANEDVALTDRAYAAFYAARNRVEFYEDALPALTWLSARFPLIAVTNGNADLRLTGGGEFFRATLSAQAFGVAKPARDLPCGGGSARRATGGTAACRRRLPPRYRRRIECGPRRRGWCAIRTGKRSVCSSRPRRRTSRSVTCRCCAACSAGLTTWREHLRAPRSRRTLHHHETRQDCRSPTAPT